LTLVKAWNAEEIESYADLINKGTPDFVEIKVCFNTTYKYQQILI